jgi:zinc protease
MKIRSVTLLTLVLTLAAPSAWAEVFGAKERVLDNGLRVVAVEIDRAPVVTHMVWYRVGAMDEPPGKSGIAHFLEHLMFKGTETRGPGEFSERVARHGGRDNAFTAQDYTGYFQSVASDRLDMVMEMEADRMVNLKIAEDHFEPEKLVVLEERAQRTDSDPSSILWEQSAAAFYRNHPYAIPIIGWRHEIEALTIRDALDFYEDWYAPNNAIVVVSGDVSAEEVFALAEKHYGPIPARDLPARPTLIEPPLTVAARVTLADPRVRQPSLVIRKPAPSWGTSDDKNELYALDVLMEILGGGNTGLLSRALVVEDGVAVAAGAWFSGSNRGPGSCRSLCQPGGRRRSGGGGSGAARRTLGHSRKRRHRGRSGPCPYPPTGRRRHRPRQSERPGPRHRRGSWSSARIWPTSRTGPSGSAP